MNSIFIPCKKNSTRIPQKNIRYFLHKRLVDWTVKDALSIPDSKIYVFSEDDEILKSFPPKIITLKTPSGMEDVFPTVVVRYFISELDIDFKTPVILLQPTSPLRKISDIMLGIEKINAGYNSAISVTRDNGFFFGTVNDGCFKPEWEVSNPQMTQHIQQKYYINGAIMMTYAGNLFEPTNWLTPKIAPIEMPIYRSIDINDMDDWNTAIQMSKLSSKFSYNLDKEISDHERFFSKLRGYLSP